ncbi:unnamed protein product [Ceutorhynchus assimilis]|uniref:Protein spire n=1 Tax=Ceutorhynchus assimilis TaxID=467358 RepID=A0A9N9MYZ0_9CUCU|nr:unnamed protein product [Ceutorhynchus assimilis]
MSQKGKCSVNSDGSVCLSDILSSFNSCIKEEHAWALCYQISKYFCELLSAQREHLHNITEVQHVFLKTDGTIHENTCLARQKPRELLRCEKDVVAGIGIVIYATLDHEFNEGEEVIISNELEQLITDMISDDVNGSLQAHHETDDEGIERDSEEHFEAGPSKCNSGETNKLNLVEVIRRCEAHLGTLTKAQAEAHYKAVVRALVAEAIELSTFLEKVAQGTISLPSSSNNSNLDELKFTDWAKFWVQVMGVKLKKVNYSKAPIEYELTPYEILMKDIRNCKYNLRKIMINGNIPNRVSKDAHAIILDFIRSRPPLRKVSDRKLPPQQRTLTPREQLLLSIKKGRKLKPVPMPRASRFNIEPPKAAGRKLLKVDFSLFDDDDDDEASIAETPDSSEPGLWSTEYQQICDGTLDAYDLATEDLSTLSLRRNTLGVTETPLGCYSVPQSRPGSRQSCNSTESETMAMEPEVARALQEELTSSQRWQDTISLDDRLSLTLSEIVHIRTVLTKAEVEALPTEGRVRHDVESRKVCFLCLKTRFGIFGPWGQRCALCKRTVCTKCYSKMNIPMEHFSSVPVVLLSPSILCTPEDDHRSGNSSRAVSKDNSPSALMEASTISDPGITQPAIYKFRTNATNVARASRVVDRLKGSQMVVCLDCKLMVLQIIKSARANRSAIRNKTLQSLTLNLSPVF